MAKKSSLKTASGKNIFTKVTAGALAHWQIIASPPPTTTTAV